MLVKDYQLRLIVCCCDIFIIRRFASCGDLQIVTAIERNLQFSWFYVTQMFLILELLAIRLSNMLSICTNPVF